MVVSLLPTVLSKSQKQCILVPLPSSHLNNSKTNLNVEIITEFLKNDSIMVITLNSELQ